MSPRTVRPLRESDFDAAMAIRSFAFGHPLDGEHRSFLAANAPNILGSFEDGELASVATMWPFTAYVGGLRKPLGGLASVATDPTARRRGRVADLLRAWFERLRERGVGLCAESPFDPRFYARYGFQSVPHGCLLRLRVELLGPAAPEDAYACFWVDHEYADPCLHVRDHAYSSPAGRRRLLVFLAGFAGQARSVLVMLPPGEARRVPGAVDAVVALGPLGLAAALFGAQDPLPLLATGTAEGDARHLAALAGLLARHPVHMPRADHF